MPVVTFKELLANHDKKIAIAELNLPKSLNALNLEMIHLLTEQLNQWQENDNIAMVILQGAGDKAFCAGGDVVSLYHENNGYRNTLKNQSEDNQQQDVLTDEVVTSNLSYEFFKHEYALDQLIHDFAKPILVWGNGYIMGGGIGLFAGASHKVVTENALLAMPEVTIGLYPDVGASWFLNKMPHQYGLFLGMTGAIFNGCDAQYIGLSDYLIAHQYKERIIEELLLANWQSSSQNHITLSQILRTFANTYNDECAALVSNIEKHSELIEMATRFDNAIDIYRALLDVDTEHKWLASAKKKLENGSPLSAIIIFEQLKRCKDLNRQQCFEAELNLSLRCCQHTEFAEGVRALLVDKDKKPDWLYKNIKDIPQETIDWFFRPIPLVE